MPRILPMRKPDPRFMDGLTVSLAQDMDGSRVRRISAWAGSGEWRVSRCEDAWGRKTFGLKDVPPGFL